MADEQVRAEFSKRIWSERWRLAVLERRELVQIGFMAIIMGLLYMLFHLFGNMVGDVNSRSAFVWMVARWGDKVSFGADYSHGFLIPFVSIGVCWWRRDKLISAEKKTNKYGLWVIVGALLLHWLGAKIQQTRLSLVSLIMMIWGVPFYLCGWQLAKVLIFPCTYLIFCVPLNFLDALAFPLRMLSAKMATIFLNVIGVEALQRGSAIWVGPNHEIPLDVADPCSGLRSLLAMTALTAVYAYATQRTLAKQWLLFCCSIPLAVFGNIGRITTIAVMSQVVGREIALGVYHDFSGYILFTVSISMMVALGAMFNVGFRERFKKWKAKILDLIS
ncbi:exosortase/archaeosortase family protein [Verrucomicrobiota bacterium]